MKKGVLALEKLVPLILFLLIVLVLVFPLIRDFIRKGESTECGVEALRNYEFITADEIVFPTASQFHNQIGRCLPQVHNVKITDDKILVDSIPKSDFDGSWQNFFEFVLKERKKCLENMNRFSIDLEKIKIVQNTEKYNLNGVNACDRILWEKSELYTYDTSDIPNIEENRVLLDMLSPVQNEVISSSKAYIIGYIYEDKSDLSASSVKLYNEENILTGAIGDTIVIYLNGERT